jgi:hypothetical protein
MTTEQLAALKEVAEQVKGPFQSALHEVMWREEFRQRFDPTTCLELLGEVERLTKAVKDLDHDLNATIKAYEEQEQR